MRIQDEFKSGSVVRKNQVQIYRNIYSIHAIVCIV